MSASLSSYFTDLLHLSSTWSNVAAPAHDASAREQTIPIVKSSAIVFFNVILLCVYDLGCGSSWEDYIQSLEKKE